MTEKKFRNILRSIRVSEQTKNVYHIEIFEFEPNSVLNIIFTPS